MIKSSATLAGTIGGLIVALIQPALADVIIDESPIAQGGTAVNSWSNYSQDQNFMVEIDLSTQTIIDGMDIYARSNFEMPVTIRVRNNVGGHPSSSNLAELTSVITSVDTNESSAGFGNRLHADFAPIVLASGSYFIGMSGSFGDTGWTSTSIRGLNEWTLVGETVDSNPDSSIGNLTFRIEGSAITAVPEPGSLAIVTTGLLGLGLMRRKKHPGRSRKDNSNSE